MSRYCITCGSQHDFYINITHWTVLKSTLFSWWHMNPKGKHVVLSMDDLYVQVQKVMFQKMLLLLGLLTVKSIAFWLAMFMVLVYFVAKFLWQWKDHLVASSPTAQRLCMTSWERWPGLVWGLVLLSPPASSSASRALWPVSRSRLPWPRLSPEVENTNPKMAAESFSECQVNLSRTLILSWDPDIRINVPDPIWHIENLWFWG